MRTTTATTSCRWLTFSLHLCKAAPAECMLYMWVNISQLLSLQGCSQSIRVRASSISAGRTSMRTKKASLIIGMSSLLTMKPCTSEQS